VGQENPSLLFEALHVPACYSVGDRDA